MNVEEIKVNGEYTINSDTPLATQLKRGEKVVVINAFKHSFGPTYFRVQSCKEVAEGVFVPIWVVAAAHLDPVTEAVDVVASPA